MPQVIVTSLVILIISSTMFVLPSYAFTSGIPVQQIPSAPTGLKATTVSSHSVQLTWNAVATATSYAILRNNLPSPGYSKIATSTTTSYLDQTANSNSCYEVSAYGPHGAGYATTSVCASTNIPPVNPTTVSTTTPTTPITSTTPPNPACQSVKTILTNSGYSATVIATVMTAMKCS